MKTLWAMIAGLAAVSTMACAAEEARRIDPTFLRQVAYSVHPLLAAGIAAGIAEVTYHRAIPFACHTW